MLISFLSFAISNILYMILHVTTSNTFPKPLSPTKEREYLTLYKETGDTFAKEQLITHNLRLVSHIMKKYYTSANDQEDFVSVGTIGLIKAIDSFKMDKGIRLSSYAAKCIENEILMQFRMNRKSAQDIYFNEPIDSDGEDNALTLMDTIADNNCVMEDLDIRLSMGKLHHALMKLEPRERNILILRFGIGGRDSLTQREISQMLRISRSYVSRIEKKALADLRAYFHAD